MCIKMQSVYALKFLQFESILSDLPFSALGGVAPRLLLLESSIYNPLLEVLYMLGPETSWFFFFAPVV